MLCHLQVGIENMREPFFILFPCSSDWGGLLFQVVQLQHDVTFVILGPWGLCGAEPLANLEWTHNIRKKEAFLCPLCSELLYYCSIPQPILTNTVTKGENFFFSFFHFLHTFEITISKKWNDRALKINSGVWVLPVWKILFEVGITILQNIETVCESNLKTIHIVYFRHNFQYLL